MPFFSKIKEACRPCPFTLSTAAGFLKHLVFSSQPLQSLSFPLKKALLFPHLSVTLLSFDNGFPAGHSQVYSMGSNLNSPARNVGLLPFLARERCFLRILALMLGNQQQITHLVGFFAPAQTISIVT